VGIDAERFRAQGQETGFNLWGASIRGPSVVGMQVVEAEIYIPGGGGAVCPGGVSGIWDVWGGGGVGGRWGWGGVGLWGGGGGGWGGVGGGGGGVGGGGGAMCPARCSEICDMLCVVVVGAHWR